VHQTLGLWSTVDEALRGYLKDTRRVLHDNINPKKTLLDWTPSYFLELFVYWPTV